MKLEKFKIWVGRLNFGKRLPTAVYILRPDDWSRIPLELAATVERAESAAQPAPNWNLLKFHTDQSAITFLSYPEFDTDPHPALAEATKINLNTGSVVHTDYSGRSNTTLVVLTLKPSLTIFCVVRGAPRDLIPHPDDRATRERLAKRPPPPLQKIYDQIEQAQRYRSKSVGNSPHGRRCPAQ